MRIINSEPELIAYAAELSAYDQVTLISRERPASYPCLVQTYNANPYRRRSHGGWVRHFHFVTIDDARRIA